MAEQLRRNTLTKEDDVLARVEAGVGNAYELVDELADEVERLRAENERLRNALAEMRDERRRRLGRSAGSGDDR